MLLVALVRRIFHILISPPLQPQDTYLDFSFLKTLPIGQVRNGTAELIKISTCADKRVWDLLVKHGKDLVENAYGYKEGAEHLLGPAEEIEKKGIDVMLKLETPNLHELGLDRVIAFGHSWSPTLELTPKVPLRHGHAINIDMAYSITLGHKRGLLSDAQRDEYFNLVTSIGLSIDHECFDDELIVIATQAIKKTRDGKQRFVVPEGEFGKCTFLNDVTDEELKETLKVHKEFVKKQYPGYEGKDAYVDAGDLGEDVNTYLAQNGNGAAESQKKVNGNGVKQAAVAAGAIPAEGKVTDSESGAIKVAA
jgi:3-dehydroquinate synthase